MSRVPRMALLIWRQKNEQSKDYECRHCRRITAVQCVAIRSAGRGKLDRDHIALTGRPCTPEDDQILTHREITMRYLASDLSQLTRGAHYLVTNAVIEEFQCDDALSFPG